MERLIKIICHPMVAFTLGYLVGLIFGVTQ